MAEAGRDLQSGELAHVSEGRVGQRVDLVVAQVSGRNIKKKEVQCIDLHSETGRRSTDRHLHQLQVFERRQLLWHIAELVSIQIPEQRDTNSSLMRKIQYVN